MTPNPLKRPERIWELDAFRGLCILCVIVIHAVFDLRYFAGLNFRLHPVFQFIMDYGGVLFVLLSGICVTLGSHSVRRGAVVFACGLVITGVTEAMIALGMADASVRIQFGVLHLLGFCMMTYPLYRRLPAAAAAGAGVVIVALGYWFDTFLIQSPFWFALGLRAPGFASSRISAGLCWVPSWGAPFTKTAAPCCPGCPSTSGQSGFSVPAAGILCGSICCTSLWYTAY